MRVEALRKEFGSTVAVQDISFTVDSPQMIGIIGRSGAGKSTLLRMINHLTPATSGRVMVDGRDILTLKGRARRDWQRDCAMIFQQFNLVPRLDVLTNVMLGRLNRHSTAASLLKMFGADDIARALHALERLGIVDQALKRAEDLSGGQQQRVAIARALTQEPRMVLADEPIASLDPMSAQVVMDALRQIHERDGLTVICNLHTLDTARTYCDRVIGMRAGEMVFDGPAEALTPEMAREIYGAEQAFDESLTSTSLPGAVPAPEATAPQPAPALQAVRVGT
ncbi:phosphonate ABC transporter ATP-binding protein [Roseospirillum parvum]|uniref:Phosphonate transport system ATP-binding protein n=1 Tax=Roseospirillum parvum TaxID=83401 RepID=A0A1G8ARE4_9PROT|nr:phosphonate ABC transporter ATP-binding protein [Roseospirillum parvum]SDH23509.1 phosphonate transport system ATP-binding protein [Roseospirillum parvum]